MRADAVESVCTGTVESGLLSGASARTLSRATVHALESVGRLLSCDAVELVGLGRAVSNQQPLRNYFLTVQGTGGGQKEWTF